jgi:hypothetical protein
VLSLQDVSHNVETAAIWLWSLKDYLKGYLQTKGEDPQVVEQYVNACQYLPIVADIANGTKHGSLNATRSGRYAKLGQGTMSVKSQMELSQVIDGTADVEVTIDDPTQVSYVVDVCDENGVSLGNGVDILRGALEEWQGFIANRRDMAAVLD